VKRIGFIVEGDSELIVLKSQRFNEFLTNLEVVSEGVFNAEGSGNFVNENYKVRSFVNIFNDKGVGTIVILTDLENQPCLVNYKSSLHKFDDKQIIIIAVKAFESWFLADSNTLSNILERPLSYCRPEATDKLPYETISDLYMYFLRVGPGTKVKLAKQMVNNGYTLQNSIAHPHCSSARYFFESLKNK